MLLLGLAVTGAPPAAEAQTVDAGRFFPVEGPRLAGEDVVWVPAYRPDRFRVDARPLAGGPTRTIFEMRSIPGYGVVVNALAASPQQVLVQQALPDDVDEREVIRIGDDGTVEALGEGCECFRRQIDLSGNVGIYNGSEPGATIRDFATPGSEPVLVSPVNGQMRVAGRYAAWEAAGDIVVYDRGTNSEAYRIPDLWPDYEDDRSLDLQADGKVAFYYNDVGDRQLRARVAWASPAEPFAHRLPVSDDASYMVKMDNDRVVFVRDAARLVSKPRDLITRTGELGIVGLTGGERVLARPVESSAFDEFFDFDGGRVAWQERTCQGAQLRVQTLDALIARPRLRSVLHPRRCRLRLRKDARYQRRKDLLPFLVDCTGFREDCLTLDPVLRTLRAYRVNGRRIPKGTRVSDGTIEVTDTQDAFEITPVGRRLILRPGRIRFGIRTDISDTLVAELRRGRITVR